MCAGFCFICLLSLLIPGVFCLIVCSLSLFCFLFVFLIVSFNCVSVVLFVRFYLIEFLSLSISSLSLSRFGLFCLFFRLACSLACF